MKSHEFSGVMKSGGPNKEFGAVNAKGKVRAQMSFIFDNKMGQRTSYAEYESWPMVTRCSDTDMHNE